MHVAGGLCCILPMTMFEKTCYCQCVFIISKEGSQHRMYPQALGATPGTLYAEEQRRQHEQQLAREAQEREQEARQEARQQQKASTA